MSRSRRRLSKEEAAIKEKILDALYQWTAGRKYCMDCTYETIARDLDITREQLAWFCPEVLGTRFLSFRKRQRVAYAASLLRLHPTMPATAAGQKAGIADKSDFRRQFAEVMGMTAERWRSLSKQ
ncbi:MAG: AraC family transcriptional regulator [Bacteroidales bacterium]|nr:AraC family transcriptional regulator [Bacteroidales bacterium]